MRVSTCAGVRPPRQALLEPLEPLEPLALGDATVHIRNHQMADLAALWLLRRRRQRLRSPDAAPDWLTVAA
jgi:hypothetical protein